MNNEITVKDLPMNYLVNQDSSFFSSLKFNNHKDLFNSLKQNTPLITNPNPLHNFNSSIISFIKDKLLDRYESLELSINDLNEEYTYLYLTTLNAKLDNDEILEDIKIFDTSTYDLKYKTYYVTQILKSPKEIELSYLNFNARNNINYSLINSVKPESTNNPLLNINQLINYFNSQENPNAIYNNSTESILLQNIIKDILFTGSLKEYIENNNNSYNMKIKKSELLKLVKNTLLSRYLGKHKIVSDLSDITPSFNFIIENKLKEILF
jgi:hypothetical protein